MRTDGAMIALNRSNSKLSTSFVNVDAERACIGSIFMRPDLFAEVRSVIPTAEAFAVDSCRRLYDAMLIADDEGKQPESSAVSAHLSRYGGIDVELRGLIHELEISLPSGINAVPFARDVALLHRRRQMARKAEKVQQLVVNDAGPECIAEAVRDLAADTDCESLAVTKSSEPLRFIPFPVGVMPATIRDVVRRAARAVGCDPSFVALPMLTVLASAIGTTRYVSAKRSWVEPPILWTALVGESGTLKTPAFRFSLVPLRRRQSQAFDALNDQQAEYDAATMRYEQDLAEWKRQKCVGDPPVKPQMPEAERYVVSDPTVESLAPILRGNPRGILLARDELSGWISSFGRYTGGASSADESHWLSMHNAESLLVDRKTGAERTINVPTAAVSIVGGIQPGMLRRLLGTAHRESGLAARLLLTMPPRSPRRWSDAEVAEGDESAVVAIVDRLFTLEHRDDEDGRPSPVVVGLMPEAKSLWVRFVNEHGKQQTELSSDLAAAWSKLEAYSLRLALVLQFVGWAAGNPTDAEPTAIDAETMEAAISLTRWFANEARRVYAVLDESDGDGKNRELVEFIERRGGRVTAREVRQFNRRFKSAGTAERALRELVEAGVGRWEPSPPRQRGQPTRWFTLTTSSTVYGNSTNSERDANTVDVDACYDEATQTA